MPWIYATVSNLSRAYDVRECTRTIFPADGKENVRTKVQEPNVLHTGRAEEWSGVNQLGISGIEVKLQVTTKLYLRVE